MLEKAIKITKKVVYIVEYTQNRGGLYGDVRIVFENFF